MTDAPNFKDAAFQTAAQKHRVYHAWRRFLTNGLEKRHFSQALYHHLYQHCDFIAHCDLHGFYATYFRTGDGREQFLGQFTSGVAVETGTKGWACHVDYRDLNQAMCTLAQQHAPRLIRAARSLQQNADLENAQRLAQRHGAIVSPPDPTRAARTEQQLPMNPAKASTDPRTPSHMSDTNLFSFTDTEEAV